ncbi:MAG: E3 UFM1-protein ligase 1 [Planctomycetes bacterium]|nr:E3 UFM1-protein ligase 1 [Planctomycetota bacterium]
MSDSNTIVRSEQSAASRVFSGIVNWSRRWIWEWVIRDFFYHKMFKEDSVPDKATGLTFSSLFFLLTMLLMFAYFSPNIEGLGSEQQAFIAKIVTFFVPEDAGTQETVQQLKDMQMEFREGMKNAEGWTKVAGFGGIVFSLLLFVRSVNINFNLIWGMELRRSNFDMFVGTILLLVVALVGLPFAFGLPHLVPTTNRLMLFAYDRSPLFVAYAALAWSYYAIPQKQPGAQWHRHLLGAFVGSLIALTAIWITWWGVHSFYTEFFRRFEYYMQLQAVLITLMLLYIIWIIILAGLEITHMFVIRGSRRQRREIANGTLAVGMIFYLYDKEFRARQAHLGGRENRKKSYATISDLCEVFGLPERRIQPIVNELIREEYINQMSNGSLVVSRSTDGERLANIVKAVDGKPEDKLGRYFQHLHIPEISEKAHEWFATFEDVWKRLETMSFLPDQKEWKTPLQSGPSNRFQGEAQIPTKPKSVHPEVADLGDTLPSEFMDVKDNPSG